MHNLIIHVIDLVQLQLTITHNINNQGRKLI